jgi:DNA-binding Lrp family transcriptional regulator
MKNSTPKSVPIDLPDSIPAQNPDLHKEVWDIIEDDVKIKKEIKDQLIKIAMDFFLTLDINVIFEDITLTGSMANFNYSEHSDFDVHILVDFSKVNDDKELVKRLMMSKKSLWNEKHNIKIKNHDIEMYVQGLDEIHYSTGVYSLVKDEWIAEPAYQVVDIDKTAIIDKVQDIMGRIDSVMQSPNRLKEIDKLKEKIRNMRQCGLETGGEYSMENLAFKTLRNIGEITKLYATATSDYDEMMSIDEKEVKLVKEYIAEALKHHGIKLRNR